MGRRSFSDLFVMPLLLLFVGGSHWSVRAQDLLPSQDELGLLYSSQVQFDPDGIPLVTIGIMEHRSQVTLYSDYGLEIRYRAQKEGRWVRKTHRWAGRQERIFRVEQATKAVVSYWCGVASIPFNQRQRLNTLRQQWTERAGQVQVFEVGSVFGIRGHVIDNRTYIIGVKAQSTQRAAQAVATKMFERYGTKTFVHPHLSRRPFGTIRIDGADTEQVLLAHDLVEVRSLDEGPVSVRQVEFGKGYQWHGFKDRQYAGSILVTLDRAGSLVVVNRVGVERLLDGLVPAEILHSVPMDALKAQAVVARGEVFAKLGSRHFLSPYLLCASTHCQVYSGVGVEKERTSRAVQMTQGELLFHGDQLVDSVYSASCGGHSENNEAVWSDPPSAALRGRPDLVAGGDLHRWQPMAEHLGDWLRASPDAYCKRSSLNREGLFRWQRSYTSAEIDRLVAVKKPVGQVVSIQVLSRGVSGRVKVVRVVGTEGELLVQREWPIRKLLGTLRSGMFEVEVELDDDQMPVAFHFIGGGWGHGVGLCQIGAVGRAEHGFDYREILSHYYNGAQVFGLYGNLLKPPSPDPSPDPAQSEEIDGVNNQVTGDGGDQAPRPLK